MCGEMLSDAVIVERRNGPRRLRANDDDDPFAPRNFSLSEIAENVAVNFRMTTDHLSAKCGNQCQGI